jgi:hypothetical protein
MNAMSRWAKLLVWARLIVLSGLIPVFALFVLAVPEGRLVSVSALMALVFLFVRELRRLRRREWEVATTSPWMLDQTAAAEVAAQVSSFWRVHLAILITQMIGAGLGWALLPGEPTLALLAGAAFASAPGFALGRLWQRKQRVNGWDRWHPLARRYYTAAALALTLVLAPLITLVGLYWETFAVGLAR